VYGESCPYAPQPFAVETIFTERRPACGLSVAFVTEVNAVCPPPEVSRFTIAPVSKSSNIPAAGTGVFVGDGPAVIVLVGVGVGGSPIGLGMLPVRMRRYCISNMSQK
jgi:hypothetical protein